MSLNVQIIIFIFSFFYGLFLGMFISVNRKLIYNENRYIKYIGSFLIGLICVLLYFMILKKINNAGFHIYCLIVLITGFWVYNVIVKYFKK